LRIGDVDGSSKDADKTLLRCAALDVALGPVGVDEVLSWTLEGNLAADDVDHPRLLRWRYIRDV